MKKILVTGNRVLIKEHQEAKKKTESGIIIPDTVRMTENTGLQKHITTGTVISTGAKASFSKIGDSVLFARQDAAEIELNEERFYVILDPQVILKFKEDVITEINTDRVLIEMDPKEKITKSGIFIPSTANFEPSTGTSIIVGSDCKGVRVQAKSLFGNAAGQHLEFHGKKYLCIREADITGIIVSNQM